MSALSRFTNIKKDIIWRCNRWQCHSVKNHFKVYTNSVDTLVWCSTCNGWQYGEERQRAPLWQAHNQGKDVALLQKGYIHSQGLLLLSYSAFLYVTKQLIRRVIQHRAMKYEIYIKRDLPSPWIEGARIFVVIRV